MTNREFLLAQAREMDALAIRNERDPWHGNARPEVLRDLARQMREKARTLKGS